ncbi:tyrosine-type recombinase/integrase [Streptomyces sp. Adlamb9]|uniref:tyrosine-type recombinase/integrase n=1 Tax=Streptomyces sp. Adlamb9 TaxID=3400629 RepID=UPI003F1E0BA3
MGTAPDSPTVHAIVDAPDATHWDEVVTRLGYDHLRRHDLRHTGLTWLADAGVPIHILRKIAGHGPLKTTQRYLHPNTHKITAAGTALRTPQRAASPVPFPARPSSPTETGQGTLVPIWSPK